MVGFVVDVEMSLSIDELTKVKQVADLWKCSVEQAVRDCLMAKVTEVIQTDLFERVDKKCNIIRTKDTENTERKQLAALGKKALHPSQLSKEALDFIAKAEVPKEFNHLDELLPNKKEVTKD